MTVQKSFKRLVRARMAKTGESYTAARTQLLAGAGPAPGEQRGAVAGVLRGAHPRADRQGLGGVVRPARLVGRRGSRPHRDRPAVGRGDRGPAPRLGRAGRDDQLRALARHASRRRAVRPRRLRRRRLEDDRRAGPGDLPFRRRPEPPGRVATRPASWSSAASPNPSPPASTSRTGGPACWSRSPRRPRRRRPSPSSSPGSPAPTSSSSSERSGARALVTLKDDLEGRGSSAGGGR